MKTERRAIARYKATLSIQVDMDDYSFSAVSSEISLQGLRAICEGATANSIFMHYIQVTPGENVFADILINIPKSKGLVNMVSCKAKVISVSRVSQSSYIVGFKIVEIDDDHRSVWQDYIATKH